MPTEPSRRHRFRSRLVRQAPAVIALSAALLAITPLFVRIAYFIPPAAMGFRRARFWEVASLDAEFARFIPWLMIVTAPSWLASRRPRRLPVRLIKGWLVSILAALVFGVIHSRLLWS